MQIRSIIDLDIPQMLSVEERAQAVPWSLNAFQRCWEAKYPGWVLEDDKKIKAFIIVSVLSGECHILNLCVDPDYQRRGFGKKLLKTAMEWAKLQGAMMVYLEVRRSNIQAIALYRQMYFNEIGERKNYYPTQMGKEDALIFARDIGIE